MYREFCSSELLSNTQSFRKCIQFDNYSASWKPRRHSNESITGYRFIYLQYTYTVLLQTITNDTKYSLTISAFFFSVINLSFNDKIKIFSLFLSRSESSFLTLYLMDPRTSTLSVTRQWESTLMRTLNHLSGLFYTYCTNNSTRSTARF